MSFNWSNSPYQMTSDRNPIPDEVTLLSLKGLGLLDDFSAAKYEQLAGGVSSDIWKISTEEDVFCVKRALPKLKVKADWFAPVERNQFEVAWYQVANNIHPGSAPRVLGHDEIAMLCAMEYLEPETHKLWKSELRDGRTDTSMAGQAGEVLGKIHSRTANDETVKSKFTRPDIFYDIRLEPYLEATATKHSDLKERLFQLSEQTAHTNLALIHGDVSPKNILIGPRGPVFLDAECACIGDPAFDIAFCLNHFLLKCLWNPVAREGFMECFRKMTTSYLKQVDWEDAKDLEMRASGLLPGLFLARVDGKSPVEYITEENQKNQVRHCARSLLLDPPKRLDDVAAAWENELAK